MLPQELAMRRGWTLLELMIVIALLIALGAVAMPVAIDSLRERAFTSAADRIENQLLLARAYAQSGGEIVQVVYQPETSTIQAQRFDPDAAGRPAPASSQPAAAFDDQPAQPAALLEAGSWASQSLADGLSIVSRAPQSHDPATSLDAMMDRPQEPPPTTDVVRLAIYLPDGSALIADPVWLVDDDGRVGKFTLNPYTGVPRFERAAAETETGGEVREKAGDPAANEVSAAEAAP
jgi:type II secretory pathway pseudopilin PulG